MKFFTFAALTAGATAAAIEPLEARQVPINSEFQLTNFIGEHIPQTNLVTWSFDAANPKSGLAKTHCSTTVTCPGRKLCPVGKHPLIPCANPKVTFQINEYPDAEAGRWQVGVYYALNETRQAGANPVINDSRDVFIELPKGSGKMWEALIPPRRMVTAPALLGARLEG